MGRGPPVEICGSGGHPGRELGGEWMGGSPRDNPTVAWGRRGPLVVGRAWKNNVLTVKLEVRDAAAVGTVVKAGVIVGARKFGT